MQTLCHLLALVVGLFVLTKAADAFVDGAVALARLLRVPAFLIGMVVVGFGTSAPELTVSTIAAADGSAELALGNAYGSNVCNILLILGCGAMLSPLAVKRSASFFEMPVLLGVTLVSLWMLRDGAMGRFDAILLLVLFVAALAEMTRRSLKEAAPAEAAPAMSGRKAALVLVLSLLALVLSSKALVWGACGLARLLGVPELYIGLTIVAVGTSLPELASTLAAARRHEDDLAVGNIVGSNLFNTLAVVGLAGVISPMHDLPSSVSTNILLTLAATLLLQVLGHPRAGADGRLGRRTGVGFLIGYAAYLVYLARSALS